jgi:hypothetical protein
MKIVSKQQPVLKSVNELKPGDIFRDDGVVLIMTDDDTPTAVDLSNGATWTYASGEDIVEVLPDAVLLTHGKEDGSGLALARAVEDERDPVETCYTTDGIPYTYEVDEDQDGDIAVDLCIVNPRTGDVEKELSTEYLTRFNFRSKVEDLEGADLLKFPHAFVAALQLSWERKSRR